MNILKGALGVILGFLLASTAFAASTNRATSISFPINISVFIPCAADGNGEIVDLSGNLHSVFSTTVNGNNIHMQFLFNPQGIVGVGETTGDKYQGTGETGGEFNASVNSFPFTLTITNNFKIIGQGPDNNLLIHENAHVTVNADGTVTAFHDNFSATCQ
jgi:hypothetical protein